MASERRIAANRANALKSTGPKTDVGKGRSAQNARRHGLQASDASIDAGWVLALSQAFRESDPTLTQEQAESWARALARKHDIQRARHNMVEVAMAEVDPDLPPQLRLDLARLAVLDRLGPLSTYEGRIDATLRRQLRRAAKVSISLADR